MMGFILREKDLIALQIESVDSQVLEPEDQSFISLLMARRTVPLQPAQPEQLHLALELLRREVLI